MKSSIILALLVSTTAMAEGAPSVVLKQRTIDGAMDKMVAVCDSVSMDVIQQTRNTLVCRALATTLRFTLVKVAAGVRVSWSQNALGYGGIAVQSSVTDEMIGMLITQKGQ